VPFRKGGDDLPVVDGDIACETLDTGAMTLAVAARLAIELDLGAVIDFAASRLYLRPSAAGG
jgi:hypothetical protein